MCMCGGHCCSLLTVSSSLYVFSTCVCVCQENMAAPQMWVSHITSIQNSALLSLCLPTRLAPAPTLTPDLTCSLSHKWLCANMLNDPVGSHACVRLMLCAYWLATFWRAWKGHSSGLVIFNCPSLATSHPHNPYYCVSQFVSQRVSRPVCMCVYEEWLACVWRANEKAGGVRERLVRGTRE